MTSQVFVTGDYLALGTGVSPQGVFMEVSGGSYARQALNLVGTLQGGLTETTTQVAAAAAPAGAVISYGAIFDVATGGNMLAYWQWPGGQAGVVGTAFPATPIAVQFVSAIMFAIGSGDTFPAGTELGSLNGSPFVAGVNLGLQNGNLVQQAIASLSVPAGQRIIFQVGGVTVASIDGSGNLILLGTSTPSGAPH